MADQRTAAAKAIAKPPAAKKWTIDGTTYVQDELTFLENTDLVVLFTNQIDEALKSGTSLDALMGLLKLGATEEGDTKDAFMKALSDRYKNSEDLVKDLGGIIIHILQKFPQLIPDVYALALSVPEEDLPEFKIKLRKMDNATGGGIRRLFILQNKQSLVDFALGWWEDGNTLLSSTS